MAVFKARFRSNIPGANPSLVTPILLWDQIFYFSPLFISCPSFLCCAKFVFQLGKQVRFVALHTLDELNACGNMLIPYRCAVLRCPPYTHGRLFRSVPMNAHQPAVLIRLSFSLRPGSHLTHSLLSRRHFASRKIAKPSKRAEVLTALARERYNHNKHPSIEIGPFGLLYAAFIITTWGGAIFFWLTHSEKAPVTGRRRFAYFSAPQSSSDPLLEEAFEQLEKFQSLIRPQSEKVRQVFRDIAVAAGVDDREWKVYIIPHLGQSSCTYKLITHVILSQTDMHSKRPTQQCRTRCRW